MTIREKAQQIARSLNDKAYSEAFVEAEIATTVPFQIRAMRKERHWTQAELAAKANTHQKVISDFENPDIGPRTIESLRAIAAAFDVGLIVRFAPFSEMVDWSVRMSKRSHFVPSRTNDNRLKSQSRGAVTHGNVSTQMVLDFVPARSNQNVVWIAKWSSRPQRVAATVGGTQSAVVQSAAAR
jgi:transcriptional regulator with XRE-family HTH domain